MIGRKDFEDTLGADYAPDDFLAGIGDHRPQRIPGPQSQEDDGAIARLVRGMRDGRFPRLRCVVAGVARFVPACVLDWAGSVFHDGTVWEQGSAAACGPGDTGVIGLERRRELDEEVGWRVINAIMPTFIIGGLTLYLLAVFYVATVRPRETFGGTTHTPSISPAPSPHATSSTAHAVLGSIDVAGPAGW